VIFYLGTHQPHWLGRCDVPLFVSYTRLRGRKRLPRARCRWALDSGGFTELTRHGRWTVPASEYAKAVLRLADETGGLDWVAPQNWMCEPAIRERTGLSVEDHQTRPIASVLELRALLGPRVHVIPVLQGWLWSDYLDHVGAYTRAGFELREEPVVGLGTVCRRQGTKQAAQIVSSIAAWGIRLHGFGVKTTGLQRFGHLLASSDSMAWSYGARKRPPLPGHTHQNCANCLEYALQWRARLLAPGKQQRAHSSQSDLFARRAQCPS
jgi:hypothetical protein